MANRWSQLAALLALAVLLFFLGLGTLGLTDRDEGRNAEAGREMVETGNWISPTYNYEPRFAKPVFVYWLMALSYTLFGVSEFTARLPSAVFGVALILLQYGFLTRVRDPVVGLLGALMLLLNIEIVAIGRMALTDSVLVFFTTLALYGFWLGLHGEGRARHFFWLLYLGMALGTLTKGPIGVAVPLLAIVPYLTLTRRWGQFWQRGFPLAGTAVFLGLALPWYGAMFALHGASYSASAQADTLGRFLDAMEGHGFTLGFYLPVLFFGFFPWSGLLPFGLYQVYQGWRAVKAASPPEEGISKFRRRFTLPGSRLTPAQELDLFAGVWVVAVFLFFTLSATRLPHYIAPLFPAAAIVAASYWHRYLGDPATPGMRGALRTLMGLGYLLGFALAAGPFLYSHFANQIAKEFPMATQVGLGPGPYMAGLVMLVGMGMVGYFGLSEERRAGAFWAAGGTIVLVWLVAIQITLPRVSRYFVAPPQELAYTAGLNLGPEDRLILYGPSRPSLVFYAKHKAIVVRRGQEEAMQPHLTQPGRTMILLPAALKSQLPPEAASYPVLLERYGYLLMANESMVQEPAGGRPAPPQAPPFHSFP